MVRMLKFYNLERRNFLAFNTKITRTEAIYYFYSISFKYELDTELKFSKRRNYYSYRKDEVHLATLTIGVLLHELGHAFQGKLKRCGMKIKRWHSSLLLDIMDLLFDEWKILRNDIKRENSLPMVRFSDKYVRFSDKYV